MGYAAKKEKAEKKQRIAKRVILFIFVAVLLALCVVSFFISHQEWKYYVGLPALTKRAEDEMRIHYIDVGQGDATLIELPDGKTMLIDGGDGTESANNALLRYLNALQIQTIDYLVVTHADADHCGGLTEVLKYKTVKRAFLPFVSENSDDSDEAGKVAYKNFYAALQSEDCSQEFSRREIALGVTEGETPYTLCFLYPYTYDIENGLLDDSNDSSSVIWLDYKGTSALFMGDVSQAVETRLKNVDVLGLSPTNVHLQSTEILKVAHHGSSDSTSAEFVNYIHAETAIVSCGENNVYGHPSLEVSQTLLAAEVETYRTDVHGSVIITVHSDGSYVASALGK